MAEKYKRLDRNWEKWSYTQARDGVEFARLIANHERDVK